jgi:signal transduction histidine kinase
LTILDGKGETMASARPTRGAFLPMLHGAKGEVSVLFEKDSNERVVLSVSDKGTGLPEGF